MSGFRELPDAATLHRLREQGWRLTDIAEKYGVTESGVWRALERANMIEGRSTYRDILPWIVSQEHQSTAVMKKFRTMLHQREGREIAPADLAALNKWLAQLEEAGLVVNYHPEAPANDASSKGGFYYTERKPEDSGIIRRPVTESIIDSENGN